MKKLLLFLFIINCTDIVAQNTFKTFGFSYSFKKNKEEKSIEVLEIVNKSDALLKGLQSGDEILQVNNIIIKDLSNYDIEKEISAAKDQGIITLVIKRMANPVALKTTELDIFECISGECNNGKGKRRNNRNFTEEEGTFKNGQLYGKDGMITYTGKTKKYLPNLIIKQTGEYFEGNLLTGKTYYQDGSVHQGRLKGGMAFGDGVYTDRDGVVYTGEFKEGGVLADGTIRVKDDKGNITERRYRNGEYVAAPVENSTPVKKNVLLYGYINNKGAVIIPLKYKSAANFNEGLAIAKTQNDELVVIDKKGKETAVKNKVYADAFLSGTNFSFNEGFCAVSVNKKYGFINAKGEDVIACEYDSPVVPKGGDYFRTVTGPPKFVNAVAVISKNGLYGVIDKSGKIVVPIAYQFITHFKNNLAVFQKDLSVPNTKGVMDIQGNIIAKPNHENIWIEDNVIRYHLVDGIYTNFYGFYNNKGVDNVESHFEYLSVFNNGAALYGTKKAPNYWGIVDASGNASPLKEKYKFDVKKTDPFKKGYLYATTFESKKMVLLNTKGERMNKSCEYDYLYEVNDGIAFGSKGNTKASYFDDQGCSLIYESDMDGKNSDNYMFSSMTGVHPFKWGYAAIKKGSGDFSKKEYEYILIDKKGKTTYSVLGGTDCRLSPSVNEPGIFMYAQIDLYDFKKPSYRFYLKGDGTVLYKGLTGSQDFFDGMAVVLNKAE